MWASKIDAEREKSIRPKIAIIGSTDENVSERLKTVAEDLGGILGSSPVDLVLNYPNAGLIREVSSSYIRAKINSNDKDSKINRIDGNLNIEDFDILIVLPGGFKTVSDFTAISLQRSNSTQAPAKVVLLNVDNFWVNFMQLTESMSEKRVGSMPDFKGLQVLEDVYEVSALISELSNELQKSQNKRNNPLRKNGFSSSPRNSESAPLSRSM